MLISLILRWDSTGTYGDRDSQSYGETFGAGAFDFDTATRQVVVTPFPNAGSYDYDQSSGSTAQPPESFSRPVEEEFHVYVSGPVRTGYFHDGEGGFTTVVTELVLSHEVVGCECWGTNTGQINLMTAGMEGPFAYLWEDGPATEDRGLVGAGTYRVAVTDVPSGAIARATIQVGSNPELQVLIQKVGPNVSLVVSGGIAPYTYQWNDGSTSKDRVGLASGLYTCLITDLKGCTKEIQVQVSVDLFFFSRNPITLALDAGDAYRLDPAIKLNLTFLCEVWVERDYLSDVFEQVGGVLEQPADRAGRTVFEVQALLDVFLSHHVPAVGATGVQLAGPMFRRFYLKYAENFGATPVRAGTTVLTQNYVVLGGLNFYESRTRTFFDAYQGTVMPFLTWEPPVKPALVDQPEFLYYLVKQSPAGFRFHVRVQYTDGASEVVNVGGLDNVRLHEVYCQAVGYQALGLAAIAGTKQVQWWEVFVMNPDGSQMLSEVRRYNLDLQVFPKRRFFLFATSLGGMATYVATGEAQLELEVKGEESTLNLTPDSDVLQGDSAVQTRSIKPVVKVASGKQRDKALQLASQDLLLSRRVLLLRGQRWLPGYIKAKNATLFDESRAVQTLDFEFHLTSEQLYTPTLGAEQFTYTQATI